jgi:hypothetical protein
MFKPNILEGCSTLNSLQKVPTVDGFKGWMHFEGAARDSNLPAVFIVEWPNEISIHYRMDYLYPYELSFSAHMTIGNYFQDICNHYDDIDYLKGTNYGYHSYSTHGVLDRVHPEDANAIGQTIYDIVMDTRNWYK